MNKQNISNARRALIASATGAEKAALLYALTLVGVDKDALDKEETIFRKEAAAAKLKDSTVKAYWSAVRRVATGKADGDKDDTSIYAYAYASQTKAAKAEARKGGGKGKGDGKAPAAPKAPAKGTAAEVFAAFMELPPSERALCAKMIAALKGK